MKKVDKSLGTALRGIILFAVAILLTAQFVVGQSSYNNAWPYRAPITITNPAGTALTDYQVQVTLGAAGPWSDAANDGSDLRFTAADGVTEIPYWIEEWTYGTSASIWVKVPAIAASPATTTAYMYYGAFTMPTPELVATPPSGPFTKHPNNPGVINGTGAPGASESILPENIVYDPVTQKYWMVLSDQTGGPYVGLVYSDDPTDPDSWYWSGYPITDNPSAIAPHLVEYNGTWYIFYGDRDNGEPFPISVATSTSGVSGPYTYTGPVLTVSGQAWDADRVDEPYVFRRSDGKWILMYMGDAGGNVEQVGYAISDNITGPYTRFDNGDPTKRGLCIPFGPSGSYDAGTVADPWVYEFDGVYYIGYTVSPTTSSPWQTALATTTDWQTFTKHGIILERGSEYNSFRGAVSRIGDQYVFSYTGGPNIVGEYRFCIATQPVFQAIQGGSNGDDTFDFFDGFDGTLLDQNKWQFFNGSVGQTSVGSGLLTMTVTSGTFVRIAGRTSFGIGYASETLARHPNQGTNNLIAEFGFASTDWNTLRILDDYPNITNWQRQAKRVGDPDTFTTMPQTADQALTTLHIYRDPTGSAGFQIDNYSVDTTSTNVPTMSLPPFLMSFSGGSTGSNNTVLVDWTRVRKWAGAEMTTAIGAPEFNGSQWTGAVDTDWNTEGNWIGGIPDTYRNVLIPDVTNQPIISANAFCDSLIVETGASLEMAGAYTLELEGNWNNNGAFIAGSGTVVLTGSSQKIGGTSQTDFANLTINSSDTVTLGANATVAGDFTISSGVLDLGSYTCDHTTPVSGTFTLAGNATLIIGGTGTLPVNFNAYSLAATSKVEYSGTDQTVGTVTYGNLVLSGSSVDEDIKTISSSLAVTGNTTIKGSAQALLGNGTNSTTATLILGSVTVSDGTWGSTISTAGYRNNTYFSPSGTGILTVANSITAGTWLGSVSTNWNSAANWAGGAVPGSATDVVITDFAQFKPLISGMDTPAECNNLTLNAGSIITIEPGQALTVNGNLTNNGSLIIESSWLNSNGSLIVLGTATGSGTASYKRYLREGNDYGDKHLFASPVGGQSVSDFITEYDSKIDELRTWDEVNAVWAAVSTDEDFASGKGYNIYQPEESDGEFTFAGSVVTSAAISATSPYAESYENRLLDFPDDPYGNTDHELEGMWASPRSWTNWGGGGWNLLGNPFTSALNAAAFITANDGDFDPYYEALYVYDGPNGYYRYVASTVPGFEPEYVQGGSYGSQVQAGQGFMVMANNNGVEFNFASTMQVHNTVLPLLKSAASEDPWPGMKLKVKWGEKENITTVVFNNDMKNGLDPGYDVGLLSAGPEVEIYTALVENDESIHLTRQALPVAGADKVAIPVGIDCYAGAEVTFSAFTVPMGDKRFWLEDRTNGIFTDITANSYTVTLPENTFGTGRFYILASTNTPTAINRAITEETGVRIWFAMDKIVIKGDVSTSAVCEIYDLQGNRVLVNRLADSELNTVDIPIGLHGVLFVRVIDGMKVTTRKVAVL